MCSGYIGHIGEFGPLFRHFHPHVDLLGESLRSIALFIADESRSQTFRLDGGLSTAQIAQLEVDPAQPEVSIRARLVEGQRYRQNFSQVSY